MGTYGDGGNAVVLRQRLRLRGIAAEIVEITLADPVPESLDLYTLGGAEDYAQRLATRHLIKSPGAAAGGRTRRPRAGDLRGHPGARALVRDVGGRAGRRRRPAGCDHLAAGRAHHRRAGHQAVAGRADPTTHRLRKPPRRHRAGPGGVAVGRGGQGRGQPRAATASTARSRAASSPPTCTARAWPATRSWPTCC